MRKVWAALLTFWSFIADTAQILGVDWKAVLGVATAMGGGAWVIGVISGIGGFQLAIGVATVMFFVAGASAFSRYRKFPTQSRVDRDELAKRAEENRKRLFSSEPVKLRYAAPSDAKDIDLGSQTNRALGELLVALANEIDELIEDSDYDAPESEMVALFNKHTAPRFLWAYHEVRNRGHRDADLDRYFENPATLKNVRHLAQQLKVVGSRLHLYADA